MATFVLGDVEPSCFVGAGELLAFAGSTTVVLDRDGRVVAVPATVGHHRYGLRFESSMWAHPTNDQRPPGCPVAFWW